MHVSLEKHTSQCISLRFSEDFKCLKLCSDLQGHHKSIIKHHFNVNFVYLTSISPPQKNVLSMYLDSKNTEVSVIFQPFIPDSHCKQREQ